MAETNGATLANGLIAEKNFPSSKQMAVCHKAGPGTEHQRARAKELQGPGSLGAWGNFTVCTGRPKPTLWLKGQC